MEVGPERVEDKSSRWRGRSPPGQEGLVRVELEIGEKEKEIERRRLRKRDREK